MSDAVQVWKAPLPMPGTQAVIRLPEPARFELGYAIAEGEPEATFRLEYRSLGPQPPVPPGMQNRVDYADTFKITNGATHTLELSPGAYLLTRTKTVRIGNFSRTTGVNTLPFAVEASREFRAKLNLTGGGPITGRVLDPQGNGLENAIVTVTTANADFDPRIPAILKSPAFDFLTSGAGGGFGTENLKPGVYTVIVEAFPRGQNTGDIVLIAGDQVATGSQAGAAGTGGFPFPALVGSARITVPEKGNAPEVRIVAMPPAKQKQASRGHRSRSTMPAAGTSCFPW